jgi:hypothetical protein
MKLSQVIAPAIELHNTLNPKIWAGENLRPEVRSALIKIAQEFRQYVDIPFEIEDIIVTGSNANYTYTKHSDLDLHLIVDFSRVECQRQAEELFDTKRLLFKRDHSITIRDIPVEIYVENLNEPVKGAVYSLSKNSWITPPEQQTEPDIDFAAVERMTRIWGRLIQRAVIHAHLPTCERLMELLRNYRRMGLNTPDREFSKGNLVYKSLRNSGSVEALAVMLDRLHDQRLSISQ